MVHSTQTGEKSRKLHNSRAIVLLHQGGGGQRRRAGRMKGRLTRAQQPRRKRISCKGQAGGGWGGESLGLCLDLETRLEEATVGVRGGQGHPTSL